MLDKNYIFDLLDNLNSRQFTGSEAIKEIKRVVKYIDEPEISNLLYKILQRDLDCGINVKSINKVWKNLIPTVPYSRCSLIDKKKNIKYPAIIQIKMDGIFCNIVKRENDIKFYTRNGQEFFVPHLANEVNKIIQKDNVVLTGELLVKVPLIENDDEHSLDIIEIDGEFINTNSHKLIYKPEAKVYERKTGNGLINSYIKKEKTKESLLKKINEKEKRGLSIVKLKDKLRINEKKWRETEENLLFIGWDMIDYDIWIGNRPDNTLYNNRFTQFVDFISDHDENDFGNFNYKRTDRCINYVDFKYVHNFEEAIEFYEKVRAYGEEGAVLKNLTMTFKDGTSTEQIKLKAELECELECIGIKKGNKGGKYENGIGSLICQSSDGLVNVNVEKGLSDLERGFEPVDKDDSSKGLKKLADFNENMYIGKIIGVKFNEFISNKNGGFSLFLARFVELREDKDEADSLEYIKKMK